MRSLRFFLRGYRRQYLLLLLAVIVSAIAEAVAVAAIYPLLVLVLDSGGSESGGQMLAIIAGVIDRVPEPLRLFTVLGAFLTVLVVNTALQLAKEWRTSSTSAFVAFDVKQRLFARYADAPFAYFLGVRPGDLTYRLSTAPSNLAFALYLSASVVSAAMTAAFILVVLVSIEWRITAMLAVFGVAVFLGNRAIARNVSAWTGRGKQAAAAAELDIIQEFAHGNKEIGVAGVGRVWAARFSEQGAAYRGLYVRDLVWASVPSLVSELAVFSLVGIALVVGRSSGASVTGGLLPVLAVFYYGVRQLLTTSSALGRQALRVAGLLPDVELLHRALSEDYPTVREGHIPAVPEWQFLTFEDVGLTYASREVSAVRGVSFSVVRGQRVAIVGASGSGKTTLVHLLLRLFDPTAGRIAVDGVAIDDYLRRAWLATVGFVSQENFLFNASVIDNIRFGRDDSAADVTAAAQSAFADAFIRDLPNGYDTVVGAHGMTLSGGQRQRIAIARALLRCPRLLVLDEATSALDSQSEELIQQALTALRGSCTQVIVAHRLSTIRDADQIVVMRAGEVAEIGTHDTLLAAGGVYAGLYRRQQVESVEAPAS